MKTKSLMLDKRNALNVNVLKSSFLFASILFASSALAVDVEKKVIVTAGVEHDSNPDMSESDKNPVWIYSLQPQLQLDIKDDLNRWYVDAAVLFLRHSNEKSLANQENPKLTAGWDRTYESGFYGFKVGYNETTARTAELNNTGAFNNAENKQTTKLLGANWQHRIASRWLVLTELGYSDVTYSEVGALDDYQLSGIKSKLTYENSEKLNTFGFIGYSLYDPDNFSKTHLSRAGLGASYLVNEELVISSQAGLYNMSGRQSDSDWEAGLKAEYTSAKSLFTAAIARNVEDSGLGFRLVDSVRLGAQYSVTERDRVGADYSFDQFKKDSDLNVSKLDGQSFGVFYARSINEHWLARLYASHKELDFTGSNPKGNVIGVTFVFDTLSF
ncbi:MAG TPA: hypothetical protein PL131_10795 [Methylotenera sp.]|nr:hypothetical protein [Methylotenera sp.]HPH06352.1 hypothetical protein [Methylotenera sp.]HPN00829.1 hypothetical protein [Methylotenera sp.]